MKETHNFEIRLAFPQHIAVMKNVPSNPDNSPKKTFIIKHLSTGYNANKRHCMSL